MFNWNHLRIFEKVASLRSFSAAANALDLPKSSVSRAVAQLEEELGTRLLQRTTREVVLTPIGQALRTHCIDIIEKVGEAVACVANLTAEPRGQLKISAGIGFGINVLAEQLPEFVRRYPEVDVTLQLTSRHVDLVAEDVDVAIRMGPMVDSSLVATRLGVIKRYLCGAPSYLQEWGTPQMIGDVGRFDVVEMPRADGRPRSWTFTKDGVTVKVEPRTRICVDEMLTIHRLVINGAGLGILSGYVCEPEILAGRLVRLLPDWSSPAVEVSIVFPSRREVAPAVRAFADFIKEVTLPGCLWQKDTLETNSFLGEESP
ncbi:LysR family transcriptional regulator [Massilia sp. CMS3.1]|uniref:LysR family transcriptional regulator n=1 Tax=Massilia sp. CMS3.1 TaxID=3373083 RepID=UPI003EE6629E